jgi:hypothetical protein
MSARLTDLNNFSERAMETHEYTLKTHEPSCIPRPGKYFFIATVHDPERAVGHMTASEPSRAGRQGSEP